MSSLGLSVQHTLAHSLNISLERQSRDLGWLPWSSCSGDVIINIFQWLSRAICRDSHLVAIEQNWLKESKVSVANKTLWTPLNLVVTVLANFKKTDFHFSLWCHVSLQIQWALTPLKDSKLSYVSSPFLLISGTTFFFYIQFHIFLSFTRKSYLCVYFSTFFFQTK